MLSHKIKKFKAFADAQLAIYIPSVRGAILLIVVPAFFIVIVYLFNIAAEVSAGKNGRAVLEYEKRLAGIKKDLPLDAVVNYVSNSNAEDDLINAEYVLIPVRLVAGLKPRHEFLIYQYFKKGRQSFKTGRQSFKMAGKPQFKGYSLKKNYGNGVMLFERKK